ncbi:hypothetical protein MMC12_005575 [Toensbergia leucococca]|nr:hypothetical protein [Toensbergia leucococca]
MNRLNLIVLLLLPLLSLTTALPTNNTTTLTYSTTTATTTPTSSSTCTPTATLLTPPPATATCAITGGETASGIFPLNYEQQTQVRSSPACAQLCLAYADNLCKSIAVGAIETGFPGAGSGNLSCVLFAYTIAQLGVQAEGPPYGPGSTWFDVGCFGEGCVAC